MIKESNSSVSAASSAALHSIVIVGSTAVVAGLSVLALWTLFSPLVSLIPRLLVVYS